ncbi:MAG TPA: glycosyltransferase family 2 protein [Dissulfurispiraceae bacterium]|nr:glycosyltransferase family 2 protein [Dissulfurispiraceae bacterium]
MPKVSVIIVNYNGERVLGDCLRAVEGQSFRDFEIVLVDNASTDGSLSLAGHLNPISLPENRGFTGGNIEGLRHCAGDYIVLLNNDTEPEKGWLQALVDAADAHPEVGICASKLINHGTNRIDSAGDLFSKALKGFKRGEGDVDNGFNREEYIFGACAGAALYRRSMLDEIGFLDEDFFLIHEDTDLNWRAQLAGWKVLYVPSAAVYHKVRSTIGQMSDLAVYYTLRNAVFVRIKNIPFRVFLRSLPSFLAGMLTEFFLFGIRHGRPGLYIKAKSDALRLLPRMLKKRTDIMKKRKVSDAYVLSLMTSVWEKKFLRAKFKRLLYG